jgi:hypothetical protein
MDVDLAKLAIERAVEETRMAYQVGASSYTYSAYLECLKARDALIEPPEIELPEIEPSWIDLYVDYEDERLPWCVVA